MGDAIEINKLLRRVVAVSGWVYLLTDEAPKDAERCADLAWADEVHQDGKRTRVSLPAAKEVSRAPAAVLWFNGALLQLLELREGKVWIPKEARPWRRRQLSDDLMHIITFEPTEVELVLPSTSSKVAAVRMVRQVSPIFDLYPIK